MPKLLHKHVFTHRGIYTKVLHTDAAHASKHRSFWTQMPFHTEAFTQIRFDIYTPINTQKLSDTDFFQGITEALTQRSLYTQNPLRTEAFTHTQAFPQKLFHREAFEHRSFYTQTPLHTEACTRGGFYAQKLLHREAFTHKRFPTEKPLPQSSFYTLQKIAVLRKFLTFGHHIVRKGCIRRWKIAIFDLGQSFCLKGLRLTL